MASERERVKRTLTEQSDSDPELESTFGQAQDLKHKYDVAVEQNRSKEQLRSMELGWIGKFLGGESTASITTAFIVVCVALLAFIGCLVAASKASEPEFWSKQAERSIALASAALSFIFGRGASRTSK